MWVRPHPQPHTPWPPCFRLHGARRPQSSLLGSPFISPIPSDGVSPLSLSVCLHQHPVPRKAARSIGWLLGDGGEYKYLSGAQPIHTGAVLYEYARVNRLLKECMPRERLHFQSRPLACVLCRLSRTDTPSSTRYLLRHPSNRNRTLCLDLWVPARYHSSALKESSVGRIPVHCWLSTPRLRVIAVRLALHNIYRSAIRSSDAIPLV